MGFEHTSIWIHQNHIVWSVPWATVAKWHSGILNVDGIIEIMGSKSCTFVNSVKYMYFLLLGQEKRGVDKLFINCLLDQVMVAKWK